MVKRRTLAVPEFGSYVSSRHVCHSPVEHSQRQTRPLVAGHCLTCSSSPPPKSPIYHLSPPRPGDKLMWETSSMSANVTVFGTERAYM